MFRRHRGGLLGVAGGVFSAPQNSRPRSYPLHQYRHRAGSVLQCFSQSVCRVTTVCCSCPCVITAKLRLMCSRSALYLGVWYHRVQSALNTPSNHKSLPQPRNQDVSLAKSPGSHPKISFSSTNFDIFVTTPRRADASCLHSVTKTVMSLRDWN